MPRAEALLLALCLAACSNGPPAAAEGGEQVSCALAGAAEFAAACALDRGVDRVLVIRHPDGAFRRFVVTPDGRELASADGADEAGLTLAGEQLEVQVGADRYRLPLPLDRPHDAR